jgi:hypothetical protein
LRRHDVASELDEAWCLIFVAAGAVFEFVVPLLLIIKGFSTGAREPRLGGDHFRTPSSQSQSLISV